MIDELHIRGLGVIEEAHLRLSGGLTVVTGETGAGKTMVVTALELLLGARADAGLVRAGTAGALIEARVDAPTDAPAWDVAAGDELIVARELPADGRSRARVNGRLVPIAALAELLGAAVEVHAQHEHVRLSRPEVQRELLDRYAGDPHARVLARYAERHAAWQEATDRLTRLEEDHRERARTIDRLRHEVAEIERAAIDLDADDRLVDERARLEHAEELVVAARQAAELLGAEAAGDPVGAAVAALRRTSGHDRELDGLLARVEATAAELVELAVDLRRYADGLELDPQRLDELRERELLLASLRRKYGATLGEVVAYATDAAAELEQLEAESADAAGLATRIAELASDMRTVAVDLHRGRRAAGDRLAVEVTNRLHRLGMPHAGFEVQLTPREPGPHGTDKVAFLLAPNPGEAARPLATAASGGERSRTALAIEAALAQVEPVSVLVFDEVDAGIGGATAMAVGEELARLARGRQVLCVTHLAQLAAFADVHHVIEKGVRGGRTVTSVRAIEDDDRVAELSRMLSGDAGREAALAHAGELIDEARARRTG